MRSIKERLEGNQEGATPPHMQKRLEMQRERQAKVAEIHEAIDNVRDYVNKGTLVDSKLMVLATLLQVRATMLVAERLDELDTGCNYEAP